MIIIFGIGVYIGVIISGIRDYGWARLRWPRVIGYGAALLIALSTAQYFAG